MTHGPMTTKKSFMTLIKGEHNGPRADQRLPEQPLRLRSPLRIPAGGQLKLFDVVLPQERPHEGDTLGGVGRIFQENLKCLKNMAPRHSA
jgi:hypothetical protein